MWWFTSFLANHLGGTYMSIINRVIGIIITLILLCQWLLGYQLPAAMAFFLVAWLIGLVTMWLLPDTTTTANR